jgi:uncharacterized protein (DUF305 family)
MDEYMTAGHSHWSTALCLCLAAGACSHSQNTTAQPAPQAAANHQAASVGGTKKAANGQYPYTDADVNFMTGMIGHHAQALVMAGWAPSHGASPSVRTLCERIINGQQDEIATMQRWLGDRGLPVPEAKPMQMDMGSHHAMMPGMLTDEQMKDLNQARGPEFDRKFLTYMIQHHKGAITMVQKLFGTNGAAQDEATFKMANDVSADQTTEIARMQSMLTALPPA